MSARADACEIAARLAERIEGLAEYLIGDAPTSRTRSALRFYPRGGFAVEIAGDRRGLWCDHAAGTGGDALDLVKHLRRCSTSDALKWASDWLGDAAPERPPDAPPPRVEAPKADSTVAARRIWQEAKQPEGTPAQAYLESRGLHLPDDAPIRFHPVCPRGRDERLPAMISLMTNPITAEPCGVHRTFLRPDGAGKIEHGAPKMMIGNAGVIRLLPDDEVTIGLGIAEGIETALAIMQIAGWCPVWSCGSAGAISKFPVLAGVEALTIFCDLDDKGAGLTAARTCADRWRTAGREVRIEMPPEGTDWFDALTARKEAA